ncbi:MAG TPA: sulfur carrier protein ThiS [Streptosporangiaceae bacterium]|nr:sulfur carrier protein ThiS [Streptosporangiaceae bacterium]
MNVVRLKVNGAAFEAESGSTVEQVVGAVTPLSSGVAAAVNGAVIPRGQWAATELRDGDQVEVVTAVQGG